MQTVDSTKLTAEIKQMALDFGFDQIGISDLALEQAKEHLDRWIARGYFADMDYMHKHGSKRTQPAELIPHTVSIISVRLNYWPDPDNTHTIKQLNQPEQAYISRYALGRDYHKVLKKKLKKLAQRICERYGEFGYRAFVDSAPVMERAIAEKANLGWIGKNTCLINKKAGSYFFLGELYTDLPLIAETVIEPNHCGRCSACIDICPTQAIVAPYQLDARRCISYLTIENTGPIPLGLRKAMGNRIYGCDDCQLFCPWNRFAKKTTVEDFLPRNHLDQIDLISCFNWDEATYLKVTEGSAMRRCSHDSWLRNVAVALGNAPTSPEIIQALRARLPKASALVKEHIEWALKQHDNSEAAGSL
jgi:epoxyqueuosine reductase